MLQGLRGLTEGDLKWLLPRWELLKGWLWDHLHQNHLGLVRAGNEDAWASLAFWNQFL